jgi:probable HAF family extracellular repeat protein
MNTPPSRAAAIAKGARWPARIRRSAILAGIAAGVLAAPAAQAQFYTATLLPDYNGSAPVVYGMNSSGTVVGQVYDEFPFVYSNGTLTTLANFGGNYGYAYAVNASGTVVGYSSNADNWEQAFSYAGGVMTNLFPSNMESRAYGINSSGVIVGGAANASGYVHAFSYSNGTLTDLGTLGGSESWATAINDSGTIVGYSDLPNTTQYHAFVYSNGTMTDIGTLGGQNSHATAINASGTVIGYAQFSDGSQHAFSYSAGVMSDLGNIGAQAINASGTIVGGGFYCGGVYVSLGAMVNVTVGFPSALSAAAINDSGMIAANAGMLDSYLLSPVAGMGVHFILGTPAQGTQGAPLAIKVAALGANNNLASSYSGTVRVTSSDAQAGLPANFAIANGVGSFSITFHSLGTQTVTVTDAGNVAITGTSAPIALPSGFLVGLPQTASMGTPVLFTVAVSSADGAIPSYSGTVHFTSSDPAAVLPADTTLSNGSKVLAVNFNTPGLQTVTATDTSIPALTGVSNQVSVSGAAAQFRIAMPAYLAKGLQTGMFVTVLDASENIVTNYTGTIHFTSSDPAAVLPPDGGLTVGNLTFPITFNTYGSQSVTATDTANPSVSGASNPVTVVGPAARLSVLAPASTGAGSPISVTVTAFDAVGDVAGTYEGFVHLTSSDPAAVLPPAGPLPTGVGSFTVTLNTVGAQTITAADDSNASISGASGPITVEAGPTITAQPAGEAVASGQGATFTVAASGSDTYQWTYNDAAITGATGPSYSISSVQPSNSGAYAVIVTGAGGSTTSAPAFLTVTGSGGPSISSQPQSLTIVSGQTVFLTVGASSGPGASVAPMTRADAATTYQWYLNGAELSDGGGVSGSQTATLGLAGGSAQAGSYSCLVENSTGSAASQPAVISIAYTSDPGRLINVSCRAQVGTGGGILITGFVVGGAGTAGSLPVLVRGSGPALAAFNVAGFLPDPQLGLYSTSSGSTLVASNTGWGGSAAISTAASQFGAFAWSNPSSHDCALLQSLPTGPYTANVSGQSDDTGVALTEVYDATPSGSYTSATPRLINVSARVSVGSGANILIAGFVVGGSSAKTVLIRASGPALAAFSVTGLLPDPELQLFDSSGKVIASNNGWGASQQISGIAGSVGAFSWGTAPTSDSALLVTLPPGPYTAQVSSASGDTGIALVEVYEVP